jgi:hypothetical protein
MFKTSNEKNLSKKEKINLLKQKHEPLFSKLGIENPLYAPKMMFGSPLVFYMFESEIKEAKDLYTEKVTRDFDSEDETRTLYVWKYNPNYIKNYETKETSHGEMYVIPFSELTPIIEDTDADEFDIPNPDDDAPFSELTIRDLAAILTGKPVSHKNWLNKIIKN